MTARVSISTFQHPVDFKLHTELRIRNSQRRLLLILDPLQERSETRGNLAINQGGSLLDSSSSTVELRERLQLEPGGLVLARLMVATKFLRRLGGQFSRAEWIFLRSPGG